MGSDHMQIKLPFHGVSGLPLFLLQVSILSVAFCLAPALESFQKDKEDCRCFSSSTHTGRVVFAYKLQYL